MTTKNQQRTVRGEYDASNFGEFLPIQLDFVGLTEQAITWSTSTIRQSLNTQYSLTGTSNATTGAFIPASATSLQTMMAKQSQIILQNDSGLILHAGANTAFSPTNVKQPAFFVPVDCVIDQIILSFAVALNVTVNSGGSFSLDSLDFGVQSFANQGQPDNTSPSIATSVRITPNSAFTALSAGALGTQVMVVKAYINNLAFRANQGQLVQFNLTVNETTGTGTRQVGLAGPQFPYLTTDVFKPFYKNEIILHVKPLAKALDKLTAFDNIAYSGVNT
jgi:hypothetical protein